MRLRHATRCMKPSVDISNNVLDQKNTTNMVEPEIIIQLIHSDSGSEIFATASFSD